MDGVRLVRGRIPAAVGALRTGGEVTAVKVTFFATGFARVPKGLFVKGAPWRSVRFPILSALVESGGELILLDTGLGSRFDDELKPSRYRGNRFFNRFVMRTEFDPSRDPLLRQLPAHGYDASAVKYAILVRRRRQGVGRRHIPGRYDLAPAAYR